VMKRHPPSSSNAAAPAGPRGLAALVLVVGLGLAFASLTDGSWAAGRAPAPYAWRDVALVHLLCALPLAAMLAAFAYTRLPPAVAVGVAAGSLAVGVVPLLDEVCPGVLAALRSEPSLGVVIRAVPALGLTLWAILVAAVLAGVQRPSGVPRVGWRNGLALGALGVSALLLPPATHVGARCRHDLARLGEFLEQSRFGEARGVVRGLLVLDADRTWNGRPLPEVAENIERVVGELESRVAAPLGAYPTALARVDRARALAMLGRTDEALDAIRSADDPLWRPEVENLRGTIHETRGDWDAGLTAYRAALAAWGPRPSSPARSAGLLRAETGVAYCLRKQGRYVEAEEAYQDVLARAPTADSHFLLAQFYEDAQQAGKAREHARRAMELAPDRYQRDGEKLIKKLTVFQFGCWGVFDAEGRGPAPTANPDGGIDRIR
jgi:hypothetical protein